MKSIYQFVATSIIIFTCFSFTIVYSPSVSKNKMSDTYLKLISTSPDFTPPKLNRDKAEGFLKTLLKNTRVEFITTDNIEFVDQGANFESISCNYCGRDIDIANWQNAMDKAYSGNFKNLSFITPCCHKTTSLNDLLYHSPAGFAKFVISIANPSADFSDNDIKELESILGTKVRKIWTHY